MTDTTTPRHRSQITGTAGLNFAAWQLSRRGWHVMPTIRNARGSDLFVTNADESVFFGVQSKGFSKRSPVPLGLNLDDLRSAWWVVTINTNSDSPVCYVLSLDEVRGLATQDKKGGRWWLEPKAYDREEFREAWHRRARRCDSSRGIACLRAAYGEGPARLGRKRARRNVLSFRGFLADPERFERPTLRFVV